MNDSPAPIDGYDAVLTDVVELLERARAAAARSVNAVMTVTYWQVGRRIVEDEQAGQARAAYGEALLKRLAADLTKRFGRGFSRQNLQQMRQFYLAWPPDQICQTPSGKSLAAPTDPARTPGAGPALTRSRDLPTNGFPLPWSAYVRLLSVKVPEARRFYETEALRNGWTVQQLGRQIDSMFYERTALSKDKASMLERGAEATPANHVTPEDAIKEPFVLEFLGLKDEYSETDLEDALITHLAEFLLELGDDFAFLARQRRLRLDDTWFRVDLVLYHRTLRCLLLVDLKIGRFSYQDAGQMHLYLNYARENWMKPGENPPVGLILCADKGADEARYALDGLPNPVLASEYRLALPDEEALELELARTRRELETHHREYTTDLDLTEGRPR
ncbi:PDDEXK nuclease domain-containing protein [Sinomonas sp. JGH33]|uniref:PDDEXK nuclease domain-containing protein n=1 Tax=Sinomonas terricola TaxID=3110330 RepID=A0ABU5TBB6_9MICC|nr:PDDEXK nuclease domain-containing protein [Sinomonas sp. JGH33]MEA5456973.1 PDDEXK nuclease domain-containing protein [Sinomonas sp. JGH33]